MSAVQEVLEEEVGTTGNRVNQVDTMWDKKSLKNLIQVLQDTYSMGEASWLASDDS